MANKYYPLGSFFRTRHGAFMKSRVGSRGSYWESIELLSGEAAATANAESAALYHHIIPYNGGYLRGQSWYYPPLPDTITSIQDGTVWLIGQWHWDSYRAYRTFYSVNIPPGTLSSVTMRLSVGGFGTEVGDTFNVYKIGDYGTFGTEDWGATVLDTLAGPIAFASLSLGLNLISLDISKITAGEPLYFMMRSYREENNSGAPADDESIWGLSLPLQVELA